MGINERRQAVEIQAAVNQAPENPDYYVLMLNPIYCRKTQRVAVAVARTKEELEKFVEEHRVDTYTDVGPNMLEGIKEYTYYKVFRKGSKLEEFNAPDENAYAPLPSLKQVLENEERRYRQWFDKLEKIGGCDVDQADKPADQSGPRT